MGVCNTGIKLLIMLLLAGSISAQDGVIGDSLSTSFVGEGAWDLSGYGVQLSGYGTYTASSGDRVDSSGMWAWLGSGTIDLGVYDITTGDTNLVFVATLTPGSSTHQVWWVNHADQNLTAGNVYAFAEGNETSSMGGGFHTRAGTLSRQTSGTLGAVFTPDATGGNDIYHGWAWVTNVAVGGGGWQGGPIKVTIQ